MSEVNEAVLQQLVALTRLNLEASRWAAQDSEYLYSLGGTLRSVYDEQIKPVLQPLRDASDVIASLMNELEQVTSSFPTVTAAGC